MCTTVNASTYGNGTQDATAGIQTAINNCPVGQVVRLSAGDFRISDANAWIELNRGIVLRGAGSTATRLLKTNSAANPVIVIGERFHSFGPSVNVTVTAAKGAMSVQVSSASGFNVGQLVLLDKLTDNSFVYWGANCPPGDQCRGWFSRPNRPVAQVLEVAGISGNTVSFTTPLHIAFDTAHTAQLTRWTIPYGARYAGLEDLYVRGGGDDNILVRLAAYSWVKNVESDMSLGDSVALDSCFRCVLRDSYVHDTPDPNPGGNGYMLSLAEATSDSLVENNIFINGNKVMVMRASGGGNVIGYNYFDNGYIQVQPTWVETGMQAAHMTCPHFELFEGNQAFNIDGDDTWGGAIAITHFRNHATGKRRSFTDVDNRRAIGLMYGHYDYSIVGNVLGTAGQSPFPYNGFAYEDFFPWADEPVPMYRLGYTPENWNMPAEARVLNTLHRHANFDYVTNTTPMVAGYDTVLPDSLYLPGKPAFFGNWTWPWVNATGAVKLHTLPARARYDGLTAPPLISIGDATHLEGTGLNSIVSFPLTLSAPNSLSATVGYATANGTATAGADFVAASGTLTIPPGSTSATAAVTVVGDAVDEVDETFRLDLSAPINVALGDGQGVATIDDDDGPRIAAPPAAVTEGDAGTASAVFDLSLSAASPQTVAVSYATSNGTATAGSDYTSVSGATTFAPGITSAQVNVSVTGDTLDEPNETFYLNLNAPVDATLGIESAAGRILDDDGGSITLRGLGHGATQWQDLAAAGPQGDSDLYLVSQPLRTSWEVVVDAASGDVGNGQGPAVVRLAGDLTVVQSSIPVGAGPSRSLRWRNTGSTATDGYVRVTSAVCSTDCGADDVYRVRAYETTLRISRFNSSAGQISFVILQNTTNETVAGEVYFWNAVGALLGSTTFTLNQRAATVIFPANIPGVATLSGSITVTHNARFGGLAGKAVTVDTLSAATFDTPALPRGH